MIGDIDKSVLTAFLSSFADDTRVGHRVKTVEDLTIFQKDLDSIYLWASTNNMEFNSSKFECLRYGCEKFPDTKQLNDKGEPIDIKEHVKDLGVFMSRDGTFKYHIRNVVVESRKMCNWVLRTFQTREVIPMVTLFTSIVRPKVEYGCQIWSPIKKQEIVQLEMIQRSFIKRIENIKHLTYPEQLKKLRLYSLERRRERYLIIYLWKMIEGLVPVCIDLKRWNRNRNGRSFKLTPHSRNASIRVKKLERIQFLYTGSKTLQCTPKIYKGSRRPQIIKFKKGT